MAAFLKILSGKGGGIQQHFTRKLEQQRLLSVYPHSAALLSEALKDGDGVFSAIDLQGEDRSAANKILADAEAKYKDLQNQSMKDIIAKCKAHLGEAQALLKKIPETDDEEKFMSAFKTLKPMALANCHKTLQADEANVRSKAEQDEECESLLDACTSTIKQLASKLAILAVLAHIRNESINDDGKTGKDLRTELANILGQFGEGQCPEDIRKRGQDILDSKGSSSSKRARKEAKSGSKRKR